MKEANMNPRASVPCVLAFVTSLSPVLLAAGDGDRGPAAPFYGLRVLREVRQQWDALGVTVAQKEEIRRALRSHRDEWRQAADHAREAREAVSEAVHREPIDEALIRQRVQEAAQAHADLAVLQARIRSTARSHLTPAQREGADRIRERLRSAVAGLRKAFRAFVDEAL